MSTTGLPADIPPYYFTETNGPIMTAGIWSMTCLSFLFISARFYAKVFRVRHVWWDDWILLISFLFLLSGSSTVQTAIGLGYGKHLVAVNPENIFPIAIYGQVSITIAVFANGLSKISFGVTLLRLVHGWLKGLVWFVIVTLALVAIPSILLPWLICNPLEKSFDDRIPGKCLPRSLLINWGVFTAAWTALMDFTLAGVPWALLWNLQMKTPEKIGVGIAMSLGLLSGATAIVKGVYIAKLIDPASTEDFSYNGVNVTIWVTTETTAAIVAASIPVLRVFIRDVKNSSYGHGSKPRVTNQASGYGLGTRHGDNKATTSTNAEIPLSRMDRLSVRLSEAESQYMRRIKGGNAAWVSSQIKSDGDSDKSILRSEGEDELHQLPKHGTGKQQRPADGQIMRTNTVVVDYSEAAQDADNSPYGRSMSRASTTDNLAGKR